MCHSFVRFDSILASRQLDRHDDAVAAKRVGRGAPLPRGLPPMSTVPVFAVKPICPSLGISELAGKRRRPEWILQKPLAVIRAFFACPNEQALPTLSKFRVPDYPAEYNTARPSSNTPLNNAAIFMAPDRAPPAVYNKQAAQTCGSTGEKGSWNLFPVHLA